MKNWFVKSNNSEQVFGPYSQELLQQYVKEGKIRNGEHLVSTDRNSWNSIDVFWQSTAELSTQMIGKYRVIKELGRGGMGVVYRVFDTELKRDCALKMLLPEIANDLKATERFQKETLALAKIHHSNIVQIYEVHQKKPYFFVMNYVDGQSFSEHIKQLNISQRLQLFSKICGSVAFAHKQGILHRDLKPENILVKANGEPVIVDFGIAKNIECSVDLTKTGDLVGTPKYMSPEVVLGEIVDHRSDVYSLGVILYQILTDRLPFIGGHVVEVMLRITSEDPIAPSLLNASIPKNSDLEIVCLKALEKKPQQRIPNVLYLQSEIDNIIHKHPIKLKPPTLWQNFSKWRKKNPLLLVTVTAMFIITCLTTISMWLAQRHNNFLQEEIKISREKLQEEIKTSQKEMVSAKKSAMYNILETLNSGMAIQNIFVGYKKIKRSYRYLYEIMDKVPLEEVKKDYRLLNMHLQFNILSKFPTLTEKKMPESSFPCVFSPQGKYIAKMYRENSKAILYIWKNNKKNSLLKDNAFLKIKNVNHPRVLFSPNNKYIVYEGVNKEKSNTKGEEIKELYVLHLEKQKNVFSCRNGSILKSTFSKDSRYYAFRLQQKRTCCLVDLHDKRNFVVRTFPVGKYTDILISPQSKWLIAQNRAKNTLVMHNIPKNITKEYKEELFSRTCRMCFCEEHKILIVSFSRMQVFDLRNQKMFESSSLLGAWLQSAPIPLVGSYFAMGEKDGRLILVKRNNDDSISQERLAHYSEVPNSNLVFEQPIFLAASKDNVIELRNIRGKNTISTFGEGSKIHQLQLTSDKEGLKILFSTEQNYKEYRLPFTRLRISDKGVKQILQKFTDITSDLNPIHSLAVEDNTFIYGSNVGFIIWKDDAAVCSHTFDNVHSVKYNKKRNQVFINTIEGNVKIYDAKNGSFVKTYKKPKLKGIYGFEFSLDRDYLYFFCSNPSGIHKQNIQTKTTKFIAQTQRIGAFLELKNQNLLVGRGGWWKNDNKVYFITPGNKKSEY
ncbi:protein kinase [Candidatus Uabimicrobium sp. HlEnr_7]|uniref:serine/threonine protein kinase n=1 Tax=Candidatus Uabimicrobium helgolandensis TaxID=3095367 RepID=UPI0035576F93